MSEFNKELAESDDYAIKQANERISWVSCWLLVAGFVVQYFFIDAFDILEQLCSQAAQLFGAELTE